MSRNLSVLVNAYACSPDMGSEPGMAWNWCVNLAKHLELHIITEGEFRDKIEQTLPTLPQGKNMHFYYNPVSEKIRRMCWNQGDWRFYYYYEQWQKKTLKIAEEIISKTHIDVVHQLNMIGFREPGFLWKLNKPFIWGPTNAKEAFPIAYLQGANWKKRVFIRLKNTLNKYQLRYNSRVHKAAQNANYIIAASTDSAKAIEKYFQRSPILINESGCDIEENSFVRTYNLTPKTLDLLWVGRFIFTKQLELALRSIAECKNRNIRLHIVGGSKEEEIPYQQLSRQLNIASQCIWHEKVSHEKVQELMKQCDLFFFTSIAEGTPHVILEAFNNSLPVLCFDTCGHGDCVNEKVGIKISLSTPQQSIKDFAQKITYLYENPTMLQQLTEGCKERQKELSWESKALQMVELYKQALN